MNLFALINPALVVLRQGHALTNVEGWKNAQALTNLGIAVGAIVAAFIPGMAIPDEVISNVAIAIAGLANWYFVYATSEKVGLPPIELQAEPENSEMSGPADERITEMVRTKNHKPATTAPNKTRSSDAAGADAVRRDADGAMWVRKPRVQPKPEAEFDSDGSGGFQDK